MTNRVTMPMYPANRHREFKVRKAPTTFFWVARPMDSSASMTGKPTAAVGAHLAGEFPDVAQAHRRAGCGQDEAQVGGPLVPLFRHKSVPPHFNRIPSTIPQNSPFFKGNVRPGRTHPFPAREYDGSSHVEGRRIPCGMN